jgi:uncharacterized protein (TIGR03435 family)
MRICWCFWGLILQRKLLILKENGGKVTALRSVELRMRHSLLLFLCVVIAPKCMGQGPAQPGPRPIVEQKREFEIAAVREDKSGGQPTSNFPLDRGNVYFPTGGSLMATNQSVVTLLIFAYKINISEFRGGLMRRLPSWATTARFDVNARSESKEASKEDMRLMMQSLLEERFKLKVHRETQQMPIFGMYLVKPGRTGPQLKPHNPSASCSAPLPLPATRTSAADIVGLWPTTCGDGSEATLSKYVLREGGRDMTMSAIADWLTGSGEYDRPFVDRTELAGRYDFVLEFDPESLGREGISSVPRDDSGPNFMEAVKEQLGLGLKKQDGPVSIFVVDNIEYPTAN